MKCPTCRRTTGPCLGERLPHLCDNPRYADYLAGEPPPPEPEPPGLATMAVNLARSVVRHVATGGRYASAEVQAGRKAICLSNECGKHDAKIDRCTACGCTHMDMKRSMASERCPLKPPKWGPV